MGFLAAQNQSKSKLVRIPTFETFDGPFEKTMNILPTCYPIDLECDMCELNEEFTEHYGEPIWMCANP